MVRCMHCCGPSKAQGGTPGVLLLLLVLLLLPATLLQYKLTCRISWCRTQCGPCRPEICPGLRRAPPVSLLLCEAGQLPCRCQVQTRHPGPGAAAGAALCPASC